MPLSLLSLSANKCWLIKVMKYLCHINEGLTPASIFKVFPSANLVSEIPLELLLLNYFCIALHCSSQWSMLSGKFLRKPVLDLVFVHPVSCLANIDLGMDNTARRGLYKVGRRLHTTTY